MTAPISRRYVSRFAIGLVCMGASLYASHGHAQERGPVASPRFAGPTNSGFLLPNGWHLTPAGKHVPLTDLPLNIVPLADSQKLVVTTNGFNTHTIALVDIERGEIVAKDKTHQSWYGLAVSADQSDFWWSGGGLGRFHRFRLQDNAWNLRSEREPDVLKMKPAEVADLRKQLIRDNAFKSGACLGRDGSKLYSLSINLGQLVQYGVSEDVMEIQRTLDLGGRPYDIQRSPRNGLLYISDWSERRLRVIDPEAWQVIATIPVGEHPNQIAFHPSDDRLFVACASSNGVWVIDTQRGVVVETIITSLFPMAPEGSTPDALAVAPDGETLFVANADNNCIAVVDISSPSRSQVKGFVPTGWYPTAVSVTPDGSKLLVGVGKGNQSKANPLYTADTDVRKLDEVEVFAKKLLPYPYIGTTMSGSLSIVEMPDDETLAQYTAQVYRNCPYSDGLLKKFPHAEPSPIPSRVGDPSPIKYVIYVIKENRTYDQVFGDLATGDHPKGNGDPSLCMFPRSVTPNHHKIAEQFVLFDNAYCNGQVSRDGHPWSTMAYNTDYIARDWHLTYSQRPGIDDDDEGELSNAPSGYIWDACRRAGISYRSYKEYGGRVSDSEGKPMMEGKVPGLVGHMCPNYGIGVPGRRERDTDLIEIMLEEYHQFVRDGNMPRFIIMSLGEDHTDGTKPGAFTPQACVASNDLALGKLVEAVSHSPLWPETAIFVIEDDAQNGPDHVDAHRTVCLVASPYAKRGVVDSTQYSTVSLIRTMELILGLQPLSQYDAAARPMFDAFTMQPDFSPYDATPAEIDLEAKNSPLAYGADRSMQMDFSEYDRIDDFELNEILWKSIMGENAPIPPAVRRAIVVRSSTEP